MTQEELSQIILHTPPGVSRATHDIRVWSCATLPSEPYQWGYHGGGILILHQVDVWGNPVVRQEGNHPPLYVPASSIHAIQFILKRGTLK